ncbi:hypothetical protein [Haloarcula nitratireducens]|uniref:Uncharacterized protein n=1 Tax=Haloarcula nitratireducens TaxID=2487749 RepID=A0AAW4PIR8_9EURY|nr:hypothetical protein [Halomicroarcula nitratireducens]MBX0297856.1 hypothetical protein [Halomicroarcula nitratireducens]
MTNANETEEEEPLSTLKRAADHVRTSAEHKQRADELIASAEASLRTELEAALPDHISVDIETTVGADDQRFIVSLYDEATTDIVADVVGDDVDIGVPHPQQFIIGDDVSSETSVPEESGQTIREIIATMEDRHDDGAPVQQVLHRARRLGIDTATAEREIDELKQQGEVYEPEPDHLRTT